MFERNGINCFCLLLFLSTIQTSKAIDAGHELDYKTSIGKWKRRDIQYCRFPGYDLTYAHYSKFPSWGLQAQALNQAVPQLSPHNYYPFAYSTYLNEVRIREKSSPTKNVTPSVVIPELQQFINENTAQEYVNVVANACVNLIYYAQLLRYYINAYSPLVLFSWWRNKISWDSMHLTIY